MTEMISSPVSQISFLNLRIKFKQNVESATDELIIMKQLSIFFLSQELQQYHVSKSLRF